MSPRPKLPAPVTGELARWGLDLIAEGRVGDYNRLVSSSARLDDLGDQEHLVAVVGNTRALWSPLLASLAPLGELPMDPVDDYVEHAAAAIAPLLPSESLIRYSHRPEPGYLSMQTLAKITGLATISPSRLAVHRRYGPWLALRMAIVLPLPGESAIQQEEPCASCAGPCVPAFERARSATNLETAAPRAIPSWRLWLAVRDACPVGASERYSDEQVHYHYTKDMHILAAALERTRDR